MESVNVQIDKLAAMLAESIKVDTDEDKELVVYLIKGLIDYNELIWMAIVDKAKDIIISEYQNKASR